MTQPNVFRAAHLDIMQNGARWCCNIINELLGSYGSELPKVARDQLLQASQALSDFDRGLRFPKCEREARLHEYGLHRDGIRRCIHCGELRAS